MITDKQINSLWDRLVSILEASKNEVIHDFMRYEGQALENLLVEETKNERQHRGGDRYPIGIFVVSK